jgi:hypothetical protein
MLGVDRDSKGEQTVPELRILTGSPTAEEIAALTTVLLVHGRTAEAVVERAPVSRWRSSAIPGSVARPGPGAWRASALPSRA